MNRTEPIHHEQRTEPRRGLLDAPPRTTFVLGLFVGVAATSIVALGLILPRVSGTATESPTPSGNVAGTAAGADTQAAAPAAPSEDPTKIAEPSASDHYRGVAPDKAKIVLVEYSDYQCPYCARLHPTMKQLMDEYQGQISWVYRHFPLTSIHPNAQPAAEAAECVAELGGNDKFWQFTDKLFENNTSLSASLYTQLAKDLKLDEKKFAACVSSQKYTQKITADETEGSAAGVNGTPGTFIMKGTDLGTAQLIAGALPYDSFKQAIDSFL